LVVAYWLGYWQGTLFYYFIFVRVPWRLAAQEIRMKPISVVIPTYNWSGDTRNWADVSCWCFPSSRAVRRIL
jgi:hypothetical protein